MNQFKPKRPRLRLEPKAYRELSGDVLARDGWRCQDAMRAVAAARTDLESIMAKWSDILTKDLPAMNFQLKQVGLAPIAIGPQGPVPAAKQPR